MAWYAPRLFKRDTWTCFLLPKPPRDSTIYLRRSSRGSCSLDILFPRDVHCIQNTDINPKSHTGQKIKSDIVKAVQNVPLLWVAGACCVVGGLGMLCLSIRWRDNYVWLINQIFLYLQLPLSESTYVNTLLGPAFSTPSAVSSLLS
jgi:hypothetical protein